MFICFLIIFYFSNKGMSGISRMWTYQATSTSGWFNFTKGDSSYKQHYNDSTFAKKYPSIRKTVYHLYSIRKQWKQWKTGKSGWRSGVLPLLPPLGTPVWILPSELCGLGFSVPTWLRGFSLEQFSGVFLSLLKLKCLHCLLTLSRCWKGFDKNYHR